MSNKTFTTDEIAVLAANPYTYRVTTGQISFTREFKQLFWTDYKKRMSPSQIFRKYGYDPKMLGHSRITGFQQTLKHEVAKGLDFHDGPRPAGSLAKTIDDEEISAKSLRELQHKIDYLEQEVEFLKKISSARNTRK